MSCPPCHVQERSYTQQACWPNACFFCFFFFITGAYWRLLPRYCLEAAGTHATLATTGTRDVWRHVPNTIVVRETKTEADLPLLPATGRYWPVTARSLMCTNAAPPDTKQNQTLTFMPHVIQEIQHSKTVKACLSC